MANNKLYKNSKSNRNPKSQRSNPAQIPRYVRPKVNLNFDGQTLRGLQFSPAVTTISNVAGSIHFVDASSTTSTGVAANVYLQSCSQTLAGVTKIYNEYKYKSLSFQWMPYVSPGVVEGGAQIYISYLDNPEAVSNAVLAPATDVFTAAKGARNMRCFNAWERYTYTVPLSSRRKSFDVNNILVTSVPDILDRSVQGAVVVGYNSPTAATSLGQWRITYDMDLMRMDYAMTT